MYNDNNARGLNPGIVVFVIVIKFVIMQIYTFRLGMK